MDSGGSPTLRLVRDVLSFDWWHWRRWTSMALYDDTHPSKLRAFYYRFWGFEWGDWQIGVRRAVNAAHRKPPVFRSGA